MGVEWAVSDLLKQQERAFDGLGFPTKLISWGCIHANSKMHFHCKKVNLNHSVSLESVVSTFSGNSGEIYS